MIHMLPKIKHLLAVMVMIVVLMPMPSSAQVIRDTEIEAILKSWMAPLLKAADMDTKAVNLILIQDDRLNAFVAGGANMFIHTGLIEATNTPEELIGVMAHELGHISGGHLISTGGALERASYESIIGLVAGIGAAILTGDAGAAVAVSSGFSSTAQRRFLAHTRLNESAADQAALTIMEGAKINPMGLSAFMEKLKSQELLPTNQQSEYVRTHPLTENRINALMTRTAASPYAAQKLPALWYDQHARMKAKLAGFINPERVRWDYGDRDVSLVAMYAKSIAAYRNNHVDEALEMTDGLLKAEPSNPYFHELKGQMLVEFGRVDEALPSYKASLKLLPNAPLIRIAYAHALSEQRGAQSDASISNAVIDELNVALKKEPRSTQAHRLMATAYGRLGDDVNARLYLAEEAVLKRQIPYAKQQAVFVRDNAPQGSKALIKAQDILSYIETLERKK